MINYELFCHKEGIHPLFFFRTVFQSSLGDFGPRFQVILCVIIYEGFWLVSRGVSREGAFVIALWSSLYRTRLFYQRIIWRTETWAALRNNSQVYEEQQIPRSIDRSIVRSRDVIHLPWLTWLLCNRRTEDLEETQGDRTVTRNIPLGRIFPSRYRKWANKTKCRVTHWAGDPCLVAAAPSDANAIVFSNRSFQLCKQQSSNQVTRSPKAV